MTQAAILAASGSPGTTTGFKNKIINGAMTIDQRNAGASVSFASTTSGFPVDRWKVSVSEYSKLTAQQNAGVVTPPNGFVNYAGITSSSSYSIVSGDYFVIGQGIEGFNIADLGWGTANAKTVTLSFWVRSSLTGTFGGSINNNAQNYSYPFTYTISAANTWEQKTVTIAGPTSGTWTADNTAGIRLWLGLGVGSTYSGTAGAWAGSQYLSATGATSVVGTSGATFYITGVQLEVGTTATNFDFRSYGTELSLCQRYYQTTGCFNGGGNTSSVFVANVSYLRMRANPSIGATGPLSLSNWYSVDSVQSSTNIGTILNYTDDQVCFTAGNFSGLTPGAYYGGTRSGSSVITLSAEL